MSNKERNPILSDTDAGRIRQVVDKTKGTFSLRDLYVSPDFPETDFRKELRGAMEKLMPDYLENSVEASPLFICAMTSKGRRAVKRIYAENENVFSLYLPSSMIFPSGCFSTGNEEIDDAAQKMIAVYRAEADNEGSDMALTREILQQSFPNVYYAVEHLDDDDPTKARTVYNKVFKIKKPGGLPRADELTSYKTDIITVILFTMLIFGWSMTQWDAYFVSLILMQHPTDWDRKKQQPRSHMHPREFWMMNEVLKGDRQHWSHKEARKIFARLTDDKNPIEYDIRGCMDLFSALEYDKAEAFLNLEDSDMNVTRMLETAEIDRETLRRAITWGKEYGLSQDAAIVQYLFLQALLRRGDRYRALYRDEKNKKKEIVEPAVSKTALENEVEGLKQESFRLTQELALSQQDAGNLRRLNEKAGKDIAQLQKQITAMQEIIDGHASIDAELAELREVIYNMASGAEEEVSNDEPLPVFPYLDTPVGSICIGGYDGWRNQMQDRFPNIRFLASSTNYDLQIVRRAPMIWIQPNYISHKAYNRLLDEARRYNVTVHYLGKQSVNTNSYQILQHIRGIST